jgi:hypothetical protein
VVADAERGGLLQRRGDILTLTDRGRTVANAVVRQ